MASRASGQLSDFGSKAHTRQRGFALIAVLSVLTLLIILVLSLSSVLHVETRASATTKNLLLARQNALTGLDVAIGQLQKYAGKDQAVTFPATTYYPIKDVTKGTGPLYDDSNFGYRSKATRSNARTYLARAATYQTPAEREEWENSLRTWWNANRNPRWTGIMDSSFRVDRATNPAGTPQALPAQQYEQGAITTFGEPKRNQLPVWLVSGNEKFTLDQSTATTYPNGYLTPDVDLASVAPDPADQILLVGEGSATNASESADGLDGRVKAIRQEVTVQDASGGNEVVGHYAYWVGDESTKANFAVNDPYAEDDGSPRSGMGVGTREYRNRLQVPQRIGWENISDLSTGTFNINDPRFENISTSKEIALLEPPGGNSATIKTGARKNFHSLTAFSKSLLTDTALGGLRKDLTQYLVRGVGLQDSNPIANPALYSSSDSRFRAWGGSNTGFPATSTQALDGIPTWGAVRRWYQNTSSGSSGAITPDQQTYPVITYMAMHAGFSYDPSTRRIRMHWLPQIVLWNPYDVPLSVQNYDLDIGVSVDFRGLAFASPNFSPAVSGLPAHPNDTNGVVRGNPPRNAWNAGTTYATNDTVVYNDRFWTSTANANTGQVPGSPGSSWAQPDFFYKITPINNGWLRKLSAAALKSRANDPSYWSRAADGAAVPGTAASSTMLDFNPTRDTNAGNNLIRQRGSTNKVVDQTMKFSISAAFAPGESKIFTLGTTSQPGDDVGNWTPGTRIPLSNFLDPIFPKSAWFDVGEIAFNGPGAGTNRGLDRTIRWGAVTSDETYCAPYVRLALAGNATPLSESTAVGFVQFDHLVNNIKTTNDALDPVSTWDRPVPSTDEFFRNVVAPSDLGSSPPGDDPARATFLVYRVWLEPFTSAGGETLNAVEDYQPAFSRFNLSSRSLDKNPWVETLRGRFDDNNTDLLNTRILYLGKPSSGSGSAPFTRNMWNIGQSMGATDAYSLITSISRDFPSSGTIPYQELNQIPVRNARRAGSEILSLGQLQQVNLSPYWWQPSFPIGNSDASPYTDREAIAGIHSRPMGGAGVAIGQIPNRRQGEVNRFGDVGEGNTMVDLSYLLNENIWDRYFLSGITGSPNLNDPLPNSRLRFTSAARTASSSELTGFDTAAAYLENVGALNVNSTSVEAWISLLTAFRDLSLGDNPSETVPIARTLDPIDGAINFVNANPNINHIGATGAPKDYRRVVSGFRYLNDENIVELAKRIVDEVRLRGPFLSLADFVNRRLVAPQGSGQSGSAWYVARTSGAVGVNTDNHNDFIGRSYDPFIGLQGLNGTIQRALNLSGINGGVNHPSLGPNGTNAGISEDRVYSVRIRNAGAEDGPGAGTFSSSGIGGVANTTAKHSIEPSMRSYLDNEHLAGSPAGEAGQWLQGAPGFVTQGDILAMIGPALTPRGDTFLIRTYGDTVDKNGKLLARVWLEAVVQRRADPVKPRSTSGVDRWRPDSSEGRRFEVVKLRWLNPSEI